MTQTEEYFLRLQNGNDVRGAAIATDTETKTLTPGLVTFICAAFGKFLAERTGKPAGALRIGVGHDSRITAGPLKEACFRGLSFSSVYDCGLISTPAMFQSVMLPASDFDGAIEVSSFNPDNDCVMLGDIVINAQKVREQALEYGHSELREYSFLVAHSMLHLCGYDHMTPEEAEVMEKRQENVLQTLGITRDQ